jgi:hypothetical protein
LRYYRLLVVHLVVMLRHRVVLVLRVEAVVLEEFFLALQLSALEALQ